MFKKLIPFLFCLLFAVGSSNAGIGGRLDSLGISVNDKLNIPRAGNDKIADSVRNMAINEAIQQVCVDFPALEKNTRIITGSRNAAIPSDYANFAWVIRVSTITRNVFPLEPLHPSLWYQARGEEAGAQLNYQSDAIPRNFWVHGDSIWLYPQPVATDTIIFAYYATDTVLTADASATLVDEEFRSAIVTLSCYKVLLISNRLAEAVVYKNEYDAMVARYNNKGQASE